MSFIKNFFTKEEIYHLPELRYGRFCDHHSTDEKSILWDEAISHFDKKAYIKSYNSLLEYLFIEHENNIKFIERLNLRLRFEIVHGSKVITGLANQDGFYASAKVVKILEQNEALYEQILKENYNLKYTRFAIDDEDHLVLIFQTHHNNASPQFLYRGLRELALLSDTKDDIIIADYRSVEPVNMEIMRKASAKEVDLKFSYFKGVINEVLLLFSEKKLTKKTHPGIYAYILLAAIFKIDYIVKPEGKILETIIEVHRIFYQSHYEIDKKISMMSDLVFELQNFTFDQFEKEIYDTISTFGILQPCNREKAIDILSSELHQASWYLENGHTQAAKSITDYAVGYLLYSFELADDLRKLLHLYFEVVESNFFTKIGANHSSSDSAKLKRKSITKRIEEIKTQVGIENKEFLKMNDLKYENVTTFAFSYLTALTQMKK